jgi:hypothetical protein
MININIYFCSSFFFFVGKRDYRPDIIIKNKKEKTRTLIDVAVPTDRNAVQKEAEKKLKYQS